MKKNVLIYGLLIGLIITTNMVFMVNLCMNNPEFESNDLLGYSAMIIVFSLIFFGIRNYRNNQLQGFISFGQAFKTGALIALIGATMYVVVWVFYYYLFVPDFLEKYIQHVLFQAKNDGATAIELASKTKEMNDFKEMYKNPILMVLITFSEVLPIGLVIALVSAFILKKKKQGEIAA